MLHRLVAVVGVILVAGAGAFAGAFLATRIGASSVTPVKLPNVTAPTPTPEPLTDVGRVLLPSVVTIEAQRTTEEALGTGWLLDSRGDFVTNAHVVAGQLNLRITDRLDHTHAATVVGIDETADVAVVRAAGGFSGTPLALDTSAITKVPLDVVALASSRATGQQDMTVETVAALHQDVPLQGQSESGAPAVYHDMLELDGARVYQGNSGGPVVDGSGAVVGIVTLASPTGAQAYAIPISRVLAEIDRFASRTG